MLRATQPQQTLACFSFTALGQCFVFRHLVAAVQDLIDQPQHIACLSGNGQHVLADVAKAETFTDLSQVVDQGFERGVIEFRGVMHQQHRSRAVGDPREGVLPGSRDNRGVSYLVGIAEPVEGTQISRNRQLVGKRAAGMSLHEVERLDQSRGAALVSELCVAEDCLTQIQIRFVCQRHGEPLLRGNKVGQTVTFLRICLPYGSLWTSIVNFTKAAVLHATRYCQITSLRPKLIGRETFCKLYTCLCSKT